LRLEPIARHAAGTPPPTPENHNKRDKVLLSGTMKIPCWQPLESTQPHMPYGTWVTYHNRLGLCWWMEALAEKFMDTAWDWWWYRNGIQVQG